MEQLHGSRRAEPFHCARVIPAVGVGSVSAGIKHFWGCGTCGPDIARKPAEPLEQGDPSGKAAGKAKETSESISHYCGGDIPHFPFGPSLVFPSVASLVFPALPDPVGPSPSKQPVGYSHIYVFRHVTTFFPS